MFDAASITAALGSAKTILDLLKNANDAHLAMKISGEVANVQGQLIDVQQQALALQQENQALRGEIETLKSRVQHHSVVWRIRADGTEDGPFCPVCVGDGRDMRLILLPHVDQTGQRLHLYCPKSHAGAADKHRPFHYPNPEPHYAIPKELVPSDYFSLR